MNCPHCGQLMAHFDPQDDPRKDQERDEVPSESGSDPFRIPRSNSTESLRKISTRGANFAYPPEYELVWSKTGKTGSKFEAFIEWKKVGRPGARVVGDSWAKWTTTRQWQGGYVPHVRKFFRGRLFEQEPSEPVAKAPGAVPAKPRADPYCWTHSSFGGNKPPSVRSNGPRTTCPACHEYQARHAGRTGEPESAEQVIAKLRALRS